MKCIFVRYNTTQKGYKAYHPSTKRFFVSIDVTFHEHEIFFPLKTLHSSPQRGCDLEVQNHDRLDQDIKLFDILPTTIEDGIQDNEDENMEDQIQNNVNENMTEYECIISPSTSNPLLIQSKNNFVEVSPETFTPFHSVVDTQNYVSTDIQCNVSSIPNSNPIVSLYTLPLCTDRGQPPIKYETILNYKVKYPINNYVSSEKLSKSYVNFVSQLSTVFTPSNLEEALANSRWIYEVFRLHTKKF